MDPEAIRMCMLTYLGREMPFWSARTAISLFWSYWTGRVHSQTSDSNMLIGQVGPNLELWIMVSFVSCHLYRQQSI